MCARACVCGGGGGKIMYVCMYVCVCVFLCKYATFVFVSVCVYRCI